MVQPGARPQSANKLLAVLPPAEYSRLAPSLTVIPLKLREFLHNPGQPITEVYFPGGGFLSIVTVLKDGDMIEVATVGREGMVGIGAHFNGDFNGDLSVSAALVQGETDTCYRMPVKAFSAEMDRGGTFCRLLNRFAQAFTGVVMQSTACNAVHVVEQRLARWLLLAHDRMERNSFPLTQESAAMMLGVTRPTVTVIAGTLQKAGLIEYHRGHVTILDREKLEAASCECYRTTTDLMTRVIDTAR